MVGVVAVVASSFLPPNPDAAAFNVKNDAYEFRFLSMTQGTNHVIYSGSSGFARLKRALHNSPLRPLVRLAPRGIRAEWYSRTSAMNTTVLWIGWTGKDYRYTVTNGIPYPANPQLGELYCFLSEPGGLTTQLGMFAGAEAPFVKELVRAWEMPANVTNWVGWTVHLRDFGSAEEVATIKLR